MNNLRGSVAVHEGDEVVREVVSQVTRAMFVRYAGASGDFNPIHWDRDFARSAGYDDVFGMGMFSAGTLAGFLSDWLGRDSVRVFRCRFVDQVWAHERLMCRGRVLRVYEDPNSADPVRWADCELTLCNAQGETKIAAWATCAVIDEGS